MPRTIDSGMTIELVRAIGDAAQANKDELTALDAPIGDSDHGINMARGFSAVVDELDAMDGNAPGLILKKVGLTLVSKVGGSSGPLYGTFFRKLGVGLKGLTEVDLVSFSQAYDRAVQEVMNLGGASVGEKTMVDAMVPTGAALRASIDEGLDLVSAAQSAAQVAHEAALATVPLQATKGRASYLGERSIGHQDPGATSFAYMTEAVAQRLADFQSRNGEG